MKSHQKYLTIIALSSVLVIFYLLTSLVYLLWIALAISVLSVISLKIASGIDFVWQKIANVMALITNTLLLSTVFLVFLTPLSLLRKAFRKRKNKSVPETFFIDRNLTYEPGDLKKTW